MSKTPLIPVDWQENLKRCSQCLKPSFIKWTNISRSESFCDRCAKSAKELGQVWLLNSEQAEIYQACLETLPARNYQRLAAAKLGLSRTTVNNALTNLRMKGVLLPAQVNGWMMSRVNANGESVRLSAELAAFLDALNSPELLTVPCYGRALAKDWGISYKLVSCKIDYLKNRGFFVPGKRDRFVNLAIALKKLILDGHDRTEVVRRGQKLSRTTKAHVYKTLRYIEQSWGVAPKAGVLWELVLEFLAERGQATGGELKEIPHYARTSFCSCLQDLMERGLVTCLNPEARFRDRVFRLASAELEKVS